MQSNWLNVWKYVLLSSLLQRFRLFFILTPPLHIWFKNHTQWPRTQASHLLLSTQIQLHSRKPSCWVSWQHKPPPSCYTSISLLRIFWLFCSPGMMSVGGIKPQGQPSLEGQLMLSYSTLQRLTARQHHPKLLPLHLYSHNCYFGSVLICHWSLISLTLISLDCAMVIMLFPPWWNLLSINVHKKILIQKDTCHMYSVIFVAMLINGACYA